MTRHQNGISALVSQTSFREETSDGVTKCRLFSQAILSKDNLKTVAMSRSPLVMLRSKDWHSWPEYATTQAGRPEFDSQV